MRPSTEAMSPASLASPTLPDSIDASPRGDDVTREPSKQEITLSRQSGVGKSTS